MLFIKEHRATSVIRQLSDDKSGDAMLENLGVYVIGVSLGIRGPGNRG